MQATNSEISKKELNKTLIKESTGRVLRRLKNTKSNYVFGAEYDISTSLLNHLERGIKDPQLTTVFKISEALGFRPFEFVKMIEDDLPDNFSMVDD